MEDLDHEMGIDNLPEACNNYCGRIVIATAAVAISSVRIPSLTDPTRSEHQTPSGPDRAARQNSNPIPGIGTSITCMSSTGT